jgi:hypothetical protein
MNPSDFKLKLHAIFESCTSVLKEEPESKVKFVHTCPDGTVYNIEVEPKENEFYVFQDGKQIDLFNLNLVDQDGAITKDKRQMIVKDWNENHKSKEPTASPAPEAPPLEENAEVIKKFQDQYGAEEGKKIYYATANKQDRDPETFKK